jgi:branched-chain amino acid transport system substrate-binding protein
LTSPLARKRLQPATFSRRLAYPTYYRVVTTDVLQGPSDAAFMRKRLQARSYFSVDAPFFYASGIVGTMQAYGTRIGLRLIGTGHLDSTSPSSITASAGSVADIIAAKGPGAVFCGCDYPSEAIALASALRRKGYSGPFVGPDVLLAPDFVKGAGSSAANSYASNPGLDPAGASRAFRNAYRRRFHVPLQFYDALAYDAANIALNAIYQASKAGTFRGKLFQRRAAILPYVAHVRWHGAAGVTTFDRNGDTTNRIVSVYAVRHGRWRYWGTAPKVSDVKPAG